VTLQGAIRYSIQLNQSREHGSTAAFRWKDISSARAMLLVHIIDLNSCDDTTTPLLEAQDTIDAIFPIAHAIEELSMSHEEHCGLFLLYYSELQETINEKSDGYCPLGS
jgi:hypothetical protein